MPLPPPLLSPPSRYLSPPLIDNENVSGCLAGRSNLLPAAKFVSIHVAVRQRGRGMMFPQEAAGDLGCSCLIITSLLTSTHIRAYLGCLKSSWQTAD